MGFIRDSFAPGGRQYAATARAADAARATQQGMDDMLRLAMAPTEQQRQATARLIYAEHQRRASSGSFWRSVRGVLGLAFVAAIVGVFYLGSLSDADTPAIFKAPTHAPAQ